MSPLNYQYTSPNSQYTFISVYALCVTPLENQSLIITICAPLKYYIKSVTDDLRTMTTLGTFTLSDRIAIYSRQADQLFNRV